MMFSRSPDAAFRRFKQTADPAALATVFDRTAPELMKMARHLTSNEAAAEDLLQATFVTAIESAEDHDDGKPALPWLVGVLGNHARAARRRGRRAPDPDRLRQATSTDPAQAVEGRELRESFEAALRSLPQPYRLTLGLYLEDGLEPIEIARRLEKPAGTIRAQISRGLDMLRRAMPKSLAVAPTKSKERSRGLDAVRAAILVRCGMPEAAAVASTTGTAAVLGGAALMNKKLATVAAAVLGLALLGYLGSNSWFDDEPEHVGEPVAENGSLESPSAGTDPLSGNSGREAVEVPDTPTREPNAEAPAPELGSLRVRVVADRTKQPVAGVAVYCLATSSTPSFLDRLDAPSTDARGEVVIESLPAAYYMIMLDRANGGGVGVDAGKQATLELAIPSGVRVHGVVRDAASQPVANAMIMILDGQGGSSRVAVTNAHGEYSCDDISPQLQLQARASGHARSRAMAITGAPGTAAQLDFALGGRGRRVSGIVRDSSGEPIARAVVATVFERSLKPSNPWKRTQPPRPLMFRTDEHGRFETDEVSSEAHVVVAHPPSGSEDSYSLAKIAAGETDAFVDIQLDAGAIVQGRVLDGDDGLAGVTVVAWAERPSRDIGMLLNLFGFKQARSASDGSFRITGLCPGGYRLRAVRQAILAEQQVELVAGQVHDWHPNQSDGETLRLEISPARLTNVMPFYGWSVMAYTRHPDGNLEFKNAATTDADGTAELAGLAPGDYDVVVRCQLDASPRNAVIVAHKQSLRAGSTIEWEIPEFDLPSAEIRGRALRDGNPAGNRRVVCIQTGAAQVGMVETVSREDGTFTIGPLPRGKYTVTVYDQDGTAVRLGVRELVANQTEDAGDIELSKR